MTGYGLCECGCGGKTNVSKKTNKRRGYIKGEPIRYIRGHNQRMAYEPVLPRFLNMVEVIPFHECWEWVGKKHPSGYGRMKIEARERSSHRVSFELFNGRISEGMHICHHCDNPGCVNPKHLFEGTRDDNMEDMRVKGRSGTKLNKADALNIYQRRGGIDPARVIAEEYGVAVGSVHKIWAGERWGWLTN